MERSSVSDDDVLRLAREIAAAYRSGSPAPSSTHRDGATARRRSRSARPARKNRDELSIGDAIGEVVRDHGWEEKLAGTRVFTDWANLVGPQLSEHARVEHFTDGVIHVRTSSTAWAKEITLLAPRLVAMLNDELGQGTVLRVEARGPQAPSWRSGPRTVRGRGPRDTYG